MANVTTIAWSGFSDGDATTWPASGFDRADQKAVDQYLVKLGQEYMKLQAGGSKGQYCTISSLPSGYALFEKSRGNDSKHVDRYLFGNPNYRFRSVVEFAAHFRSLQDNGNTLGCSCNACTGGRKHKVSSGLAPSRGGRSGRGGRGAFTASSRRGYQFQPGQIDVDEEGTADPYHKLVQRLRTERHINEPIREPTSFDWCIEQHQVKAFTKTVQASPAFLPRLGELVLFVRELSPSQIITFDDTSQSFLIWDHSDKSMKEPPQWEAGLVTEVPKMPPGLDDLLIEQPSELHVNLSGYSIEAMPPTGSIDKHWSKRKAQIPLRSIRPFVLYREVLNGLKPAEYHPTVQHALTVMASVSLAFKYHFNGTWPSAIVYSKAIYIGCELLVVGDTVRLIPGVRQPNDHVLDFLQITSIKLKLIHVDAAENSDFDVPENEDEVRYHDCCIHIDGIGFTRDPARAWPNADKPVSDTRLPAPIRGYGFFYHLHDPARRWRVPFTRILGRCFEGQATSAWFSGVKAAESQRTRAFAAINSSSSGNGTASDPLASVDKGLKGITLARAFSKTRDVRIRHDLGKSWFWADHRVEQLDVHEVKGLTMTPTVHGAPTRDLQAWRRAMLLREKYPGHKAKNAANVPATGLGRMSLGDTSMMRASAVGGGLDDAMDLDDASSPDGVDQMDIDPGMESAVGTDIVGGLKAGVTIQKDVLDLTNTDDESSVIESE